MAREGTGAIRPNMLTLDGFEGDYFGAEEPICLQDGIENQVKTFLEAYGTLANDDDGKLFAQQIIDLKMQEVKLLNEAVKKGGNAPSEAYIKDMPSFRDNLVSVANHLPSSC